MTLTPTQEQLISRLRTLTPARIERRPGGFWTGRGVPERGGVPEWYFVTGTVKALLKTGVLKVTREAYPRAFHGVQQGPAFAVECELIEETGELFK